jgi:hypothetical protein
VAGEHLAWASAPARVAKLADAGGLNPPESRDSCGFDPRPGHHLSGKISAEVTQVLPSDELGEFVEVKVVQQYPSNWGRIVDASGNTVFDLVPDPLPTEPTVEVRYTLNRPQRSAPG